MAQHVEITVKAIKGADGRFYIVSGGNVFPVDENEIVLIDYGYESKADDDDDEAH